MTMMASDPRCEDLAYTKQFFSITHIGHTIPTAEFGAPTMVWQVSTWPRRHKDPHEFNMRDSSSSSGLKSDEKTGLKNSKKIREEYGKLVRGITDSFNDLLLHLQRRGCVTGSDPSPPFDLEQPLDWEIDPLGTPSQEPDKDAAIGESFEGFTTEATGFTLWWPDAPRGEAARSSNIELSLLGDGPERRPCSTDLRVRVQAEMNEDFSTITFFLDTGKPWDEEPVNCAETAQARGLIGKRRGEIFRHIETIRAICENRLRPQDPALVDLGALPERICSAPPEPPPPIAGKSEGECAKDPELRPLLDEWKAKWCAWLERENAAARALLAAADYLYKTVWEEFCRDFGFNLCDIAGRTNEVFANFRGLVMSTKGMTDPGAAYATGAAAGDAGTRLIPRFNGGGSGHNADDVEPKAVVKAFQPFMRRFRSDADWRDWIACSIFDERAIYITPLGSQSEFRRLDEGDLATAIPAGHLPERLTKSHTTDPKSLPECADYVRDADGYERSAPETHKDDRPAPFRYLVLTKHAPNRKLIGRMIERVNTTGVRRLYALKNWTVLRQASTWLRIHGQQLDEVYLQWIRKTGKARREYLDFCESRWKGDLRYNVDALADPDGRSKAKDALKLRDSATQERAIAELSKLCDQYCTEESFILDRLDPGRKRNREQWNKIRNIIDDLRHEKEERDITLAELNQNAEHALIEITAALDKLGQAAVGGLSYRISRSRYFAELYRSQAENLRDSNIETWWSYRQFAKRGMEPTLRFIESIGDRLGRLNARLRSVKQDILQSSINNQTESTRDNTHKLERIQTVLSRAASATEQSVQQTRQLKYIHGILGVMFTVAQLLFAFALFAYHAYQLSANKEIQDTTQITVKQTMEGAVQTIEEAVKQTIEEAVKKIPR